MKNIIYILSVVFLSNVSFLFSQNDVTSAKELPSVFEMGRYADLYADLYEDHPGILLEICNNNLDAAFDKWVSMIYQMEEYSKEINFDLKGIKIWLNVFWDKSGKINNMAYNLKPNSRTIPPKEMQAFLKSFIKHYKLPIDSEKNFNHSGSASFPTFGNGFMEEAKKGN